eukprot:CAMPEP_0202401800 /NCGR_PEP_ID=MMETSP1128-20130828/3742_1 /ASSEMBLY_ACC=CAM_ASM_000463 /TAXON_ID=3047 /ORGANISM="Dunaliella tertiolecta, Strain CCMP1320" /LENGTH=188 /DNA_ID=CAMNT_0049005675 /DNA_START=2576 /DNA_END=3139 /DNA_ORIENTATION=-
MAARMSMGVRLPALGSSHCASNNSDTQALPCLDRRSYAQALASLDRLSGGELLLDKSCWLRLDPWRCKGNASTLQLSCAGQLRSLSMLDSTEGCFANPLKLRVCCQRPSLMLYAFFADMLSPGVLTHPCLRECGVNLRITVLRRFWVLAPSSAGTPTGNLCLGVATKSSSDPSSKWNLGSNIQAKATQ